MPCISRCFSRRAVLRLTVAAASRPLLVSAEASSRRATVALVRGDNRSRNIAEALVGIDEQIKPFLARKKYVLIKPNFVSTSNQLASTHVQAVQGILDYLAPRFSGPVVVAEASAGDTMEGFEAFHYNQLRFDRRSRKVQLIDLNREAQYQIVPLLSYDLRPTPARFAARLMDPEGFVISAAMLKTHNAVVATMGVKNMGLGAPLHSVPRETPSWNDKRIAHNGLRQTHYNIFLAAQAMKPSWGVSVLDGFEGMEGDGPTSGTAVASRVAIASTDYIAADRIGLEVMGIDPAWVGYLRFCGDCGIGQYDLSKIDVRGERIETVRRKYKLHENIQQELEWLKPLGTLPRIG